MKVSKRSLIVSIAVLCVCALSLSAASFAWFSTSQVAKVTSINLTVDTASDLQISLDNQEFAYSVDWSKEYTSAASVLDSSTTDGISFVEPELRDGINEKGEVPAGTNYKASSNYVEFPVYFRSKTPEIAVLMNGAKFTGTQGTPAIAAAMRVAGVDDAKAASVLFANTAGSDVVVNGTATLVALTGTASEEVVTLDATPAADGYYHGQITVRYWVEGTDEAAINANTGVAFVHSLVFSAPALANN